MSEQGNSEFEIAQIEQDLSPRGVLLEATRFTDLGERRQGKVRDIYDQGDTLALVATDRFSAFDRNIALIPYKGELITQISKLWLEQTQHIIPNAAVSYPDLNVTVEKKCSVLPVEVIVRGYITGVTNTSLWVNYDKGQRNFGGFILPNNLRKNQELSEPVITPTTKDEHDRPLTPKQVVDEGYVDFDTWQHISYAAIRLYNHGRQFAREKGLILVDTKYEFGFTEDGELVLVDELHTPDSSRYWQLEDYETKFLRNLEPDNYDKEFLRLWIAARCDPYKDPIPDIPDNIIGEQAARIIRVYEQLTGNQFQPNTDLPMANRIHRNLIEYFPKTGNSESRQ